jgi:hypothetical protein
MQSSAEVFLGEQSRSHQVELLVLLDERYAIWSGAIAVSKGYLEDGCCGEICWIEELDDRKSRC